MAWTRSFGAVGNRDTNNSLKKLSEITPTSPPSTNPEIKEKLEEVNQAIESGDGN